MIEPGRLTRIFLSSTFAEMAEERNVVLSTLADYPDTVTWLPRFTSEHPHEFYDEISKAILNSDLVILLIGETPGQIYDFVDTERFSGDELSWIADGPGSVVEAARRGLVDNAFVNSGESHTQVEARFYVEPPPTNVVVFIRQDWLEKLEMRRRFWEGRGIHFHQSHLHETECEFGTCWEAPDAFHGECRTRYYRERQQKAWSQKARPSPEDRYWSLTQKNWSEISWINFTLDILKEPRFETTSFTSAKHLAQLVRTNLQQIRRKHLITTFKRLILEMLIWAVLAGLVTYLIVKGVMS